jgi:hypothetical protein
MKEPKLVVYVQIDGRYLDGIADSNDMTTRELLKVVKHNFEQRLKHDLSTEVLGAKTVEIKVEYELDFPTVICIDFGQNDDWDRSALYLEDGKVVKSKAQWVRLDDSDLLEKFGVKNPKRLGREVAELFLRSLICLGSNIPKRYMSRITIAR